MLISDRRPVIGYTIESKRNLSLWSTHTAGEEKTKCIWGKWRNETDRTITFEEEPTGDLLAFLEANATPQ